MKYVFIILLSLPMLIKAESVGNWMMYIGNNPISEKYSIWNEIQYRDRRVLGDFTQLIVRTGLNYTLSNESQVLLGYAYIIADPAESSYHEHRLFQQGIHRHAISSFGIQKRKSNTVIASPFGVVMVLATRTAGAFIMVWSTVKLSNNGIFSP